MEQRNTWRHALPSAAVQGVASEEELGEAASTSARRGAERQYGEVPRQPAKDDELQAALDSTSGLWRFTPGAGTRFGGGIRFGQALGSWEASLFDQTKIR